MGGNNPQPPKRPLLEVMAEQVIAWRRIEAAETLNSIDSELPQAQERTDNAFRKMLQQMRDQRNGY